MLQQNYLPLDLIQDVVKHAEQNIVELMTKRVLPSVYEIQYPSEMRGQFEQIEPLLTPDIISGLQELLTRLNQSGWPSGAKLLSKSALLSKWMKGCRPKPCTVHGGRFFIHYVEIPEDQSDSDAVVSISHRVMADSSRYSGTGTTLETEDDSLPGPAYASGPEPSTCEVPEPAPQRDARAVIAEIEVPNAPAYEMRDSEVTIGRAPQCHIHVEGRGISREHAKLRYLESQDRVEVMECSSNWAILNQQKLKPGQWTPVPDQAALNLAGAVTLEIRLRRKL